ncbi:MAG: gamma-glutamyltransferase family protein [Hyphomicrobiaceae bacterium]|nr:gamma-glutamyltransferase family protein [Hyphomicrobiaceae bacterium]
MKADIGDPRKSPVSAGARRRPIVSGTQHMVVAGHHLAAQSGFSILEAGGNAVDAGVAAIVTLAVVQPDMVNVAGVAPILVYLAETNEVVTISGLGGWPKAASVEYFEREHGGVMPEGIARCVVPAAPDAWISALENYGTMSFGEVSSTAIRLAEEGFATHGLLAARILEYEQGYRRYPSNAEIYLPSGRPPTPGELFVQKDLARSLKYMADQEKAASSKGRAEGLKAARDAFYRGDLARAITKFHEENGGLLRMEDFESFSVAIEPPVSTTYKEYEVYTCGPWCQGPVLAQMLNMLEPYDLKGLGHNSPDYVHVIAEVIKLAYSDRERFFGDPRFVDVPIDSLLSKDYAAARRELVRDAEAWPQMPPSGDPVGFRSIGDDQLPEPPATPLSDSDATLEGMDTSYACVVDRHGNVFSGTPSDSSWDGVIVPGTGLSPSTRGSQSRVDHAHPSSVEPGKRPRLTPNPALIAKHGKPIMPIGTPGGDAQTQSMLQVFLNAAVFKMDAQSAVEAPRFLSQSFPNSFAPNQYYPGRLNLEHRLGSGLGKALEARGHKVCRLPDFFWRLGAVCTIVIDRDENLLQAGADPRNESYAVGW